MDGDRIARARSRIEQAIARIEAAANAPRDQPDREAARKYQVLRQEAGAALAELDRLIASLEA